MPDESRKTETEVTPPEDAAGMGQTSDSTPPLPSKIGQYTIKRVIASGGMGVVYEALQEKPRRTVALKVIKSGIASTNALHRFEYESQLLARLQHPGIAQVYEAGTHSEGTVAVPYFAMEYIPNARSVTEYADEKKMGTRERLELFAQVCDAVHHGHQKGIIHRDLKPGNILVSPQGQVKIIDFGVARSTDSDMALTTLQTDVGQLIGTLQYMSPEQCEADPHDIDTRSDVYALGVVQYKLLCGRLPYDVKKKALHEVTRVIREEQPTRPSTISKRLRGDVETIALKALEKERDRRYQSAVELSQDIRRYLAGEAIVGRPPSIVYQLRIFARRHRTLFGALAAILIVLAAGLVASSAMYLRAEQAREDMAWERDRALAAEQEAEAVTGFLSETLAAVDPSEAQGSEVTVREVLDKASEKIGEAFAGQPLAEATLRLTIGNTYRALGEYPAAQSHLETALALRSLELGEEHPDTLKSMSTMALLNFSQGRYDEAEVLIERTLTVGRRVLGGEHPDTLNAMNLLASSYERQGRYDEAESLFKQALEICQRVLGEQHPETMQSMSMLATLYLARNQYDKAEPLAERVLEIRCRDFGNDDPRTLTSMGLLGEVYRRLGHLDEAERLLEPMNEVHQRIQGDEHPETLIGMRGLAGLYWQQGQYKKAETLFVKVLNLQRRVLGDEHSETLITMNDLALLHETQGRYEESESLFKRSLEVHRRLHGEEHPHTLSIMNNLAWLHIQQCRFEEAEALFTKTYEARRRLLGDEHPSVLNSMVGKVTVYLHKGQFDRTEPLFRRMMTVLSRTLGEEHLDTIRSVANLAELYRQYGRYDIAESLIVQVIEFRRRVQGEEHPDTLTAINEMAVLYFYQGRYAEAEPLFAQVLQIRSRELGEEHPNTLTSMNNLASLYSAQDLFEKAEPILVRTLEIKRRQLGEDHPDTLLGLINLAKMYRKQGRYAKAEPLFISAINGARHAMPKGHWYTGVFLSSYGQCLTGLERYDEAEKTLIEAHQYLIAVLGVEHFQTMETVRMLVELYNAWNKPEKAAEWRTTLPEPKPPTTESDSG